MLRPAVPTTAKISYGIPGWNSVLPVLGSLNSGWGSLCLVWVQSISLLQALGVLSVSYFLQREAIEATQIGSMTNIMALACFAWSMSCVLTDSTDLPKSQGKGY